MGGDARQFRAKFGRDMLLMGGVDKHILARTKADIDREIERLTPLVEQGGYIPMPDHRVPPDVPFENYMYYVDQARAVWGRGVALAPPHRQSRPPQPAPATGGV